MSMVGRINVPYKLEEQVVGGEGAVWQEVGSFWGRLKVSSGEGVASHQIIARYNPASMPKTGQRASFNNDHYVIVDVVDGEANKRWLTLFVKEEKYLN